MTTLATRRMVVGALSMSVVWLSGLAHADEAKVAVQADVVFASEKPGKVPQDLVEMQQKLAKGKKYLTLTKLSSQKLTLTPKASTVALPNQSNAELSVVSLEKDVATLQLRIPKLVDTTVKVGKGSLYQQAGQHDGGDLWLVLSQPK